MIKFWYLVFFYFVIMSCNSQDKKIISNNFQKIHEGSRKINLYFYPSSGGEMIYSLEVKNDSLIVKNHEPLYPKRINYSKELLSKSQLDSLNKLAKKLIYRKTFTNEVVLDSWRVVLKVDDKKIYEKTDFSIEELPEDVKNIVNYLRRISPVKIELYGFS